MSDIKVPVKASLDKRLQTALKQQNVSMLPPDKPKKTTPAKDMREVITSPVVRAKILSITKRLYEHKAEEKLAKQQAESYSLALKELLTDEGFKAGAFVADTLKVTRYAMTHSTINVKKLLACGVSARIIGECTDVKYSDSLRVSYIQEEEAEDEV